MLGVGDPNLPLSVQSHDHEITQRKEIGQGKESVYSSISTTNAAHGGRVMMIQVYHTFIAPDAVTGVFALIYQTGWTQLS